MNIALFLGAGASVCLDMPTTKSFKERLRSDPEVDNLDETTHQLLYTLLDMQEFPDIEHVLKCIEDITSKNHGIKLLHRFEEMGARQAIVEINGTNLTMSDLEKNLSEIREIIKEAVFRYYSWMQEDRYDEILNEVFGSLIRFLGDESSRIIIFTTNYDCIIEEHCSRNDDLDVIDGFEYSKERRVEVWKGDFSHSVKSDKSKVYLHKLHGSLNWKDHKKNGFVKTTDEIKMNGTKYRNNLLIYPTLDPKEAVNNEPYVTIHNEFERSMRKADVCISIGYSFRDSDVNKIFQTFIRSKKGFISISPTSSLDYYENLCNRTISDEERDAIENRAQNPETLPKIPDNIFLIDEELTKETIDNLLQRVFECMQPWYDP